MTFVVPPGPFISLSWALAPAELRDPQTHFSASSSVPPQKQIKRPGFSVCVRTATGFRFEAARLHSLLKKCRVWAL
jgi:hypothetical protein